MNRPHSWSQLLLATALVGLVSGAYWVKVQTPPPRETTPTATTSRQLTDSLLTLGIRLQQIRQYDGALRTYRQVLQHDPASPHAHYNIAQIYNERGQYAEARTEYEEALKANPQFLDARLNLGVVLYRQRQFKEAAEAFRQVLQASPKHPMGLFNIGVTLLELGQANEAIRQLEAALSEDPKRADAHYYLGVALSQQGRLAEAQAALAKAAELASTFKPAASHTGKEGQ